jgi:hypothetical protein
MGACDEILSDWYLCIRPMIQLANSYTTCCGSIESTSRRLTFLFVDCYYIRGTGASYLVNPSS